MMQCMLDTNEVSRAELDELKKLITDYEQVATAKLPAKAGKRGKA